MAKIALKPFERAKLERAIHDAQDVRFFRRVLALRWIAEGHNVTEVAELLQVNRKTVYEWINIWQENRSLSALQDADREGRPPVWTNEMEKCLCQAMSHRPKDYGLLAVNWTIPSLVRLVFEKTGVMVSATTIRRRLHELDYEWKRPRYVLEKDPDYDKKNDNLPKDKEF